MFAEYRQDNNYKFNTAKLFRLEKDDPAYLFRIPGKRSGIFVKICRMTSVEYVRRLPPWMLMEI